jgi:hypothetical protein
MLIFKAITSKYDQEKAMKVALTDADDRTVISDLPMIQPTDQTRLSSAEPGALRIAMWTLVDKETLSGPLGQQGPMEALLRVYLSHLTLISPQLFAARQASLPTL